MLNRNIFSAVLSITVILIFTSGHNEKNENPALSEYYLWYDKPATHWMTEALPIGNGSIGGMVFGGVAQEKIQFNEISLWTGDEKETGAYQNFGELIFTFADTNKAENKIIPADYRRKLDISSSIHSITYSLNGVGYTREYFCSYPNGVMVLQFTANKSQSISTQIEMNDAHNAQCTVENNIMSLKGKLVNGLEYVAKIMVVADGGTLSKVDIGNTGNSALNIQKANKLTLLFAAGTNYSNKWDKNWRGKNPEEAINERLKMASTRKYEELKAVHIKDYSALFNRVNLNLGTTQPEQLAKPTYQRIKSNSTLQDPQLEALLFQWGRYLLISSSRPGSLPANLQGLWNNTNTPPWRCDYHSNINIQMNYWLAEPTNLSECHLPFIYYVNSIREVRKQLTQTQYPGVRGWTVQTENNIFGGSGWKWNPPGSAWYSQHLWEHYAFTQNKEYLQRVAYPVLKEICQFWEDHLIQRKNGTWVTPDGWSPEHGPEGEGVTYDQEIVYDLFTNYIEAADSLGIDQDYRNKIFDLRKNLLPLKIGKWGQLQEWEDDIDDPKDQHRHISHLFALHPGRQISPYQNPELANAAKVTLIARGDYATGWSMAWKMNFWARLYDGNRAYGILNNFITLVDGMGSPRIDGGGLYANLLCAHPPFQIDGNFGYSAGVSEMLLQSHDGQINLLPALPDAWSTGNVNGLCARGGFVIDLNWKAKKLISCTITSTAGYKATIRYGTTVNEIKMKPGESILLDSKLRVQ